MADDDLILIYDTSADALRKMTKANFAKRQLYHTQQEIIQAMVQIQLLQVTNDDDLLLIFVIHLLQRIKQTALLRLYNIGDYFNFSRNWRYNDGVAIQIRKFSTK